MPCVARQLVVMKFGGSSLASYEALLYYNITYCTNYTILLLCIYIYRERDTILYTILQHPVAAMRPSQRSLVAKP